MEMNWGNLVKLCEAARDEQRAGSPLVDVTDEYLDIEGWIWREFVEKFIAEHKE